jgi:hypothetical protein
MDDKLTDIKMATTDIEVKSEVALAPIDQIATPVMPLAKKINAEALIGRIVTKEDFCEIEGKIEPKRDLALKLFATAKLNYDTELLNQMPVNGHILIAVKARIYQDTRAQKKVAEGLGGCTTEETARSGKRAYHDALARAETRAFKRALEAAVGLPFINQIILRLFGGYEAVSPSLAMMAAEEAPKALPTGIAEEELLDALKHCVNKCRDASHLKNWGKKYVDLVRLLSEEGQATLRDYYREKRGSLKPRASSPEVPGTPFDEVLRMAKVSTCEEDRDLVLDLARELTEEERLQVEQTLDLCQRSW